MLELERVGEVEHLGLAEALVGGHAGETEPCRPLDAQRRASADHRRQRDVLMRGRVEHEVRDRAAAVAGPLLPPLDGNDVADALHEPCAHAVVLGDDPLAESTSQPKPGW